MFPALFPGCASRILMLAAAGLQTEIRSGGGRGMGKGWPLQAQTQLTLLDTEIRRQDKRTRKSCVRHLVRREPAAASYAWRCWLKVFQGGLGSWLFMAHHRATQWRTNRWAFSTQNFMPLWKWASVRIGRPTWTRVTGNRSSVHS